jgi:phosphoribosyl 1,2-cyclic phosphate phosphodiesterase
LHRFKLSDVSFCLITHPHEDHLTPDELAYRLSYAAHMKHEHPFVICGVKAALDAVRKGIYTAELEKDGMLVLKEIKPFEPFEMEGYRITALKADHGTPDPVFYIIEKEGQALLYAHDTGLFPEETMAYLASIETKFDFISYDCTNVLLEWNNRGHMGLTGNTIMRQRLADIGKIKDSTVHVVNHFSHNGLAGYDQLMPIALSKGFMTSFDGMEVEF